MALKSKKIISALSLVLFLAFGALPALAGTKTVGDTCNSLDSECKDGLVCKSNPSDGGDTNVCAPGTGTAGNGDRCISEDSECKTGLTCQSNPADKGETNICSDIGSTVGDGSRPISADLQMKQQVVIPNSIYTGLITFKDGTAPIALYIKDIYHYGVSIVGILAAIMLMIGGVIWLTSEGSSGRIEQAKTMIFASLSGLFLVLSSYILLSVVNPDLVNFRIREIPAIARIQYAECCKSGADGGLLREVIKIDSKTGQKVCTGSVGSGCKLGADFNDYCTNQVKGTTCAEGQICINLKGSSYDCQKVIGCSATCGLDKNSNGYCFDSAPEGYKSCSTDQKCPDGQSCFGAALTKGQICKGITTGSSIGKWSLYIGGGVVIAAGAVTGIFTGLTTTVIGAAAGGAMISAGATMGQNQGICVPDKSCAGIVAGYKLNDTDCGENLFCCGVDDPKTYMCKTATHVGVEEGKPCDFLNTITGKSDQGICKNGACQTASSAEKNCANQCRNSDNSNLADGTSCKAINCPGGDPNTGYCLNGVCNPCVAVANDCFAGRNANPCADISGHCGDKADTGSGTKGYCQHFEALIVDGLIQKTGYYCRQDTNSNFGKNCPDTSQCDGTILGSPMCCVHTHGIMVNSCVPRSWTLNTSGKDALDCATK